MEKIKFSVITVVYNEVHTIERTIQSVISQTYKNFEYIIIDGKSTDGTLDIIKKYSNKIHYWISEIDNGVYDAMNKGIGVASGDYIAFLNGNDWYEKGALETIYNRAVKGMPNIIYGLVKKHSEGNENGYIGTDRVCDPECLHFENIYCHQGLFIKKRLFKDIGLYDNRYKICSDYEWILKAHDSGIDPVIVTANVSNFVMGGLSGSEKSFDEYNQIMAKHYNGHSVFRADLEKKRGIVEFNRIIKEGWPISSKLFKVGFKYYIWGTGEYGKKCYFLAKNNNIQITSFIDENIENRSFMDLPVITIEDLADSKKIASSDEEYICVASVKYEDEMCEILVNLGVDRKRYFTVSQLFHEAYVQLKNYKFT